MRVSVVVDGVTLTREQVEKAYKALNEPVFGRRDIVTCDDMKGRFIVVGGPVSDMAASRYGCTGSDFIRITDGYETWIRHPNKLTRVGGL